MPIAAAIPAIIGGGTALIAGSMQSSAAKKTASAVQSASDQSAATQRYIFDQTRADNAVRQGAGDAATRQMMALMGLGGGGGFAPQQSGQAASYNGGKDGSGPMYAQGQGGAQTLPQSTNALSGASPFIYCPRGMAGIAQPRLRRHDLCRTGGTSTQTLTG